MANPLIEDRDRQQSPASPEPRSFHETPDKRTEHKLSYRPEIDGLRAIAVIAVFLFHGGFGCEGGYIGVDVFFVISGFLITSLIWNDLQSGRFSFAQFWERRARRIIPAAVVMTIATLAAGWFLLLPSDFQSLGRAAAAQSVFAANVHYWRDLGYFTVAAIERPLLHTWTLAVEEQFYFVIPFMLWAMFRWSPLRRRSAVTVVLVAGLTLSFALAIHRLPYNPTAVFYLLPTRAWELLLGSIVAFFPIPFPFLRRQSLRELLSLSGLVLILVPVFVYTSKTPFPGLAALPPCLGAALIIWSNGRHDSTIPTRTGSLLSMRPVVFIGLISYSLYLWHWPFIAFANYLLPDPISPGIRALLMTGGFVCAVLSWKYVEAPFRTRKCGASRRSMFAWAGAGLAFVLGVGLLCVKAGGFPQRLSPRKQAYASATSDKAFINELTTADVLGGRFVKIGVDDPSERPQFFVWGDSFAMAALPAVDAYLKERGIAGYAATRSAMAPVVGWYHRSEFGLNEEAVAFNNGVISFIERRRIPNVLLVGRWNSYVRSEMNTSGTFEASLLATVRRLVATGAHPWILLEVPTYSFSVPRLLSVPVYSNEYIASLQSQPGQRDSLAENDPDLIERLEEAGAFVLDPKPHFVDPASGRYRLESGGVALYRDADHLSAKGAKIILLPLLRERMTTVPGRNGSE